MDMTQLAIDLPESAFSALRMSPHEFAAEMRLAAAVQWYSERRISQGKAAEIAGLSRAEFLEALRRRRVSALQLDTDELEGELNDA
jgi:predicted HTH domain antitoxin